MKAEPEYALAAFAAERFEWEDIVAIRIVDLYGENKIVPVEWYEDRGVMTIVTESYEHEETNSTRSK
jgi:hypothetical protein